MQRYLSAVIRYGLYGTLFLPLLFTSFTYFPWLFGKTIIFQIVVELLLLCWLLWAVKGRPASLALRGLDWSIIIFLSILIITAITGVSFAHSFWGYQARADGVFTWLHFGVWYFLMVNTFKKPEDWKKLLAISVGVAVLVSLTIFFQQYLPAAWQSEADGGIIGNRGFAASYLLGSIGLTVLLFTLWQSARRWFLAFPLFILVSALIYVANRGAFVGLAVGAILAAILSWRLITAERRRKVFLGVISGLVIIAGCLFIISRYYSTHRENFPEFARVVSFSNYFSATAQTRLLAWRIGWRGFAARPFLGWGPNNFDVVFNKYYDPQFLRFSFSETVWDKPHNWFLELADGGGAFGVVSYVAILMFAGYAAFKKRTFAGAVVLASLAAGAAQNFFLFETSNSLLLFFLLLAFVSSQFASDSAPVSPSQLAAFLARLWRSRWFVEAYAILALFLFWRFNYISLQSSYYLSRAQAAVSGQAWAEKSNQALSFPVPFVGETAIFLAERFTQLEKAGIDIAGKEAIVAAVNAADVLEKQSERYPDNPLFSVWAGQVYMTLGEKADAKYYASAEKMLLRAHSIAPLKQEFIFFLGRLYLLKKDFSRAIAYQEQAVASAPAIGISHWFLGLAHIASGDVVRGLQEIELAVANRYALSLDQRLYVLDIYAGAKKYDKVISEYRDLISSEPENVNWHIRLATAYALAGEKAAALKTAEAAVSLYPPLRAEADSFIKQYKLK